MKKTASKHFEVSFTVCDGELSIEIYEPESGDSTRLVHPVDEHPDLGRELAAEVDFWVDYLLN